jgi:transcriptional regulator with XRE-family HTH domain
MSKEPVDPAIAKAREAFQASGKTMDEVGLAMGFAPEVARKSVWQLLNKVADPRLSTLRRFAAAVGVSIEELVGEEKRQGRLTTAGECTMRASTDLILSEGLTAAEEVKFDRVKGRVVEILLGAGFDSARFCRAVVKGGRRKILLAPAVGRPLVSISAEQFLAYSDEEYLSALRAALERLR